MNLKAQLIQKGKNANFKVTVSWLLDEIEDEIKNLEKAKNQQKIDDRLGSSKASRKIGFGELMEDEMDDNIIYGRMLDDDEMGCEQNSDSTLPKV